MASRAIVLILTGLLLLGCGDDAEVEPGDDGTSAEVTGECTEREGGWFGERADGTLITSQTQEACEERLRR